MAQSWGTLTQRIEEQEQDHGHTEEAQTMAQQALASGSPNNNPLIPDQPQIESLYRDVWQ